jgi:hypothetical protein
MHVPINVKSNNISKWQMGLNSAFKGLTRQTMYVQHNTEPCSCYHCCSGKYYISSVCVCRLRYPAYSAHAPYRHLCPARPYNIFPHYLTNGTIFEKKIEHKMCILIVSKTSVWNVTLKRNERNIIKKLHWCSCNVFVSLIRFYWNLNFLDRFSKNTQIPNFMKIRSVGVDLFHADGRTQTWRS